MVNGTVLNNGTIMVYNDTHHVPKETNLYLNGGYIQGIGSEPPDGERYEPFDVKGMYICPGLIDIHVHGGGRGFNCIGGKYDDSDQTIKGGPSEEVVKTILQQSARHGTTTMLLSAIATEDDNIRKLLEVSGDFFGESPLSYGGAEMAGIELEGPFLKPTDNGAYTGALESKYMNPATIDNFRRLVGDYEEIVKKVAIGFDWPDENGSGPFELARYLAERDIMPCIGHSGASKEQVLRAVKEARKMIFIHYGNGPNSSRLKPSRERTMEAISETARMIESGCDVYVENVLDGVHIPSEFIAMAYSNFGPDNIIGITDNIGIFAHSGIERFKLGNSYGVVDKCNPYRVWVEGHEGDKLFGSLATTGYLLRNAIGLLTYQGGVHIMNSKENLGPFERGVGLSRAIKMLSTNPARALGLKDRGYIKKGAIANIIALGTADMVKHVWVHGKKVA